jgi:hypothetical protein
MEVPHIFENRPFRAAAIFVGLLVLAMLVTDIFIIGGDAFIFTYHSALNAPFAIIVAISAYAVWRRMSPDSPRRQLWAGLVLGWATWAVAETIWALFSVIGQEVPYPSPADLFWVFGYVPMGIGLLARIRTTPFKPTRSQWFVIWGVSALTVLVTFIFVFIPILQAFDPGLLVESVLNIIYPLADLFLLIVVWWMFFAYEKGDYGFSWRLLTIGFILMTFSDLFFTYADWQGFYYPDMQANLISRLVIDFPYTVSYLVWFLSIYALGILLREERPVVAVERPELVPAYGHILVYTDSEDNVLSVSPTFERIFDVTDVHGKSLAEALSISRQDQDRVFTKLRFASKVTDLPVTIQDRNGVPKQVLLCGLAPINTQREYSGANLVLRFPVAEGAFDFGLSLESRGMVKHVLARSGSQYEAEICQFLLKYYRAYLVVLLQTVTQQGGVAMSAALLDELRGTAVQHGWPLQFNPQTVLEGEYPLEVLRAALPLLLEKAQGFAAGVSDPGKVGASMREVELGLSQAIHDEASRFIRGDAVFSS